MEWEKLPSNERKNVGASPVDGKFVALKREEREKRKGEKRRRQIY